MIRIAFIMLCHKCHEQINGLIDKLSEFENTDIYIHVDMRHLELRNKIERKDNVFLLSEADSFAVKWGSIDIVKATLSLIQAVKASNRPYDYIWLISGQDYPIVPAKEIERRLESQQGMNYIETIVMGDAKYNRYKKLYEVAYPSWINRNSFIVKSIKRLYMIFTGGYTSTFSVFIRKKPFDFEFSFGSQWWVLTADAAFDILDYSKNHPEILQYYEKCIIPDESFFQTLFLRGPYSKNRAMNLTYINWGKNRRSPETLTVKDIEKLYSKAELFCFARKFDYKMDAEVFKILP